MRYYIQCSIFTDFFRFSYIIDSKLISTLDYYKNDTYFEWYIIEEDYSQRKYNYNKIRFYKELYYMTEEEYFQRFLIWDYKFPLDIVSTILKAVNELDYNEDLIKNKLVEKLVEKLEEKGIELK